MDDRRTVRGGARDLALVGRGRNVHVGAQAVARGGGRYRAGEVPRRGAGERVEVELLRARERQRDRPVLEGKRRVARVVLNEKSGHADRRAQARRREQRGPADRVVRLRLGDRQ